MSELKRILNWNLGKVSGKKEGEISVYKDKRVAKVYLWKMKDSKWLELVKSLTQILVPTLPEIQWQQQVGLPGVIRVIPYLRKVNTIMFQCGTRRWNHAEVAFQLWSKLFGSRWQVLLSRKLVQSKILTNHSILKNKRKNI
jgi:hypothetical protein